MNIGCRIAQRITASLTGKGIPYQELVDTIYSECQQITNEAEIGDWIEMPDGSTFKLTWKPTKK